jgi:hypothetical protein
MLNKMETTIENKILEYVNSQSRNKIVFYRNEILDIKAIDIGKQLAQRIYNFKDDSNLPIKITSEIDGIINDSEIQHAVYGRVKALSNVGILIEHELKQDLTRLMEKHSNGNVLFIKWDGEIDQDDLYFLSKEKGIKINIKNLSHIII